MPTTMWPRVLIDATPPSDTTFEWDYSSWDGGDKWRLTPTYTAIPDADIRQVSVRRGGKRWGYDAGEAVIVLNNLPGRDYDAMRSTKVYGARRGVSETLIRHGMLVQVAVFAYGDSEFILFTGRLTDLQVNPDPYMPTVTWIVEDALAELGRHELTEPAGATGYADVLAADVLDEALHSPYTPGEGQAIVTTGGRELRRASGLSARALLDRFATSAAGRFFINREGKPVLHTRGDEAAKPVMLTLTPEGGASPYAAARLAPGFGQVTNAVTVKRDGAGDVTRRSARSSGVFGARELTVDAALAEWADAAELAQFLADFYSQPSPLAEEVTLRPATWSGIAPTAASLVELGDVVEVVLPNGDDSHRSTVERIAWDFDASGVSLTLGLDRYDPAWYGNPAWFVWDESSWDDSASWSAF